MLYALSSKESLAKRKNERDLLLLEKKLNVLKKKNCDLGKQKKNGKFLQAHALFD